MGRLCRADNMFTGLRSCRLFMAVSQLIQDNTSDAIAWTGRAAHSPKKTAASALGPRSAPSPGFRAQAKSFADCSPEAFDKAVGETWFRSEMCASSVLSQAVHGPRTSLSPPKHWHERAPSFAASTALYKNTVHQCLDSLSSPTLHP